MIKHPGDDYDPKKDDEFGDLEIPVVNIAELVCPMSILSGKHIKCFGKACGFWSYRAKNPTCIFISTFNQLSFLCRRLTFFINREDRRRAKKIYYPEKGELE